MFEILVWEVKRTPRIEKRVRERAIAGLCLHFDEKTGAECCRASVSLGNCREHVNKLNYEQSRLPTKKAKVRFRRDAILKGLCLGAQEQRKFKRLATNTYARIAEGGWNAGRPC